MGQEMKSWYPTYMSIEKQLGKGSTQEHGEKKDPRQEAADALYDALAPYRQREEDDRFSQAMHEKYGRAMSALLSIEVSKRLGEAYKVGRESGYFYLANSQEVTEKTLGVFAEAEVELPTGKMTISYSVNAQSKYRDSWDQRYFDQPVVTESRFELVASPEVVKKTYDKLEAEYAKELERYERRSKAFDQLWDWVVKLKSKRIDEKTWDTQPFLEEFWPWAKGAECEISRRTSPSGEEQVELVIFDGERIADIMAEKRPKKPERWFAENTS